MTDRRSLFIHRNSSHRRSSIGHRRYYIDRPDTPAV